MSTFKDYSPIPPRHKPGESDEDDITSYESTLDIWRSRRLYPRRKTAGIPPAWQVALWCNRR
jgi:hypothetical protein